MHKEAESALMGQSQRVYGYGSVVLGVKPGPGLTWGYWGAAIRAVDSMWRSWDAIELDFVIGVEDEGVLGTGFLTTVAAGG